MDSLTQIALGAAVGEAALGRKVGYKAPFWGAIAGTIPDLDVLARNIVDTVTATEWHRGFSHSILFSLLFAPLLGYLVCRAYKKKEASWREWTWLFFLGLFTHPLLDAFTTWGTQLFWPFELRLAFQSIFVIDPLYTLPFLGLLISGIRLKKTNPLRRRRVLFGIGLSSLYLVVTLLLKGMAYQKFEQSDRLQHTEYTALDTRPAPFNTLLWMANVATPTEFLLGEYSFFDKAPISYRKIPKNHELLGDLAQLDKIKRLIAITEGWYAIHEENGTLYFNDLRFGLLSLRPDETRFAFSYALVPTKDGVQVKEVPKVRGDAKKLLKALWERIWGI